MSLNVDREDDYHVFVSYASKDRDWVETLVERLKAAGVRVLYDRDFELGEPSTVNMQNAVARSKYTVLVLTPAWVRSSYANYEARLAVEKGLRENARTVLPLLLEPCELPDDVKTLTYSTMVNPASRDAEIAKLIRTIRGESHVSATPETARIPIAARPDAGAPAFGSFLDVLAVSDVRTALTNFREDFREASRNILKLADMKAIHDLLHKLQSCHDLVVQQTRLLDRDENAYAELILLCDQVRSIGSMVREISRKETVATTEQFDWIGDLFGAHDLLSEGIEKRDGSRISAAARTVDRILAVQPSFIDRSLSDCTTNLRLRELRTAVEFVCSKARERDMPEEKIQLLSAAAAALEEFHRGVNDLVKTHTFWQVADVEMRYLEASLSSGIEDLLHAWPLLREKLTRALRGGDEWAEDLAASRDSLDSALAGKDAPTTRLKFRVLRRQAVLRFMHVDTQLNERCKELRVLGEKLAFVSEVGS